MCTMSMHDPPPSSSPTQSIDVAQLLIPSQATCAREGIRMTSDSSLRASASNRSNRFVIARERQRPRQSAFMVNKTNKKILRYAQDDKERPSEMADRFANSR